MTWVIAGKHLFCARCLADVHVTLSFQNRDTVYIDCIQKVHRIGKDLVVAFADSVRLGFFIVEKLKTECYGKLDRRICSNPHEVSTEGYPYLGLAKSCAAPTTSLP